MKKLSRIAMSLLFAAIVLISCNKGGNYILKADKSTYAPGETIKVEYTANAAWDANAWIGIIPSSVPHGKESVNDENDVAYQHLNKSAVGTLQFTAPTTPGKFDLRMNDQDDPSKNGIEVASFSFEVK